MLHDLEDGSDMEDPGDAGVDLRVDNVFNNVEYPHAIPEALEMNDTNADLSGVSDTTAVETRGMDQTDAIREVTPDTSPDVHSASDTTVVRTLRVDRNKLEDATSNIPPNIT